MCSLLREVTLQYLRSGALFRARLCTGTATRAISSVSQSFSLVKCRNQISVIAGDPAARSAVNIENRQCSIGRVKSTCVSRTDVYATGFSDAFPFRSDAGPFPVCCASSSRKTDVKNSKGSITFLIYVSLTCKQRNKTARKRPGGDRIHYRKYVLETMEILPNFKFFAKI